MLFRDKNRSLHVIDSEYIHEGKETEKSCKSYVSQNNADVQIWHETFFHSKEVLGHKAF